MATKTDLAGVLRDTPGCLRDQLLDAVLKGKLSGAWALRAKFKVAGSSTENPVAELNGECLTEEGIPNVIKEVEESILPKVGPAPRGYLRIFVYVKGLSQVHVVDLHRTLDLIDSDAEEREVQRLRAQLGEERLENRALRAQLHDFANQLVETLRIVQVGSTSAQVELVKLGTIKAQAGIAGELGQLHSALGLVVLMVGLPMMRQVFNVRPDASAEEVVAELFLRLKQSWTGIKQGKDNKELTVKEVGEAAPVSPPAEGASAEMPEESQDKQDKTPDPKRWVDALEDPAFRRAVAVEVRSRPVLMLALGQEMQNV
jgi:hypothetical protein